MICKILAIILLVGIAWAFLVVIDRKSGRSKSKGLIKASEKCKKVKRPLNSRKFGYSKDEAIEHWKFLKSLKDDLSAFKAEKRFLEFDLVFPFFYGAALATTLLFAWDWAGRPFDPAWIMILVGLAIGGDWIENLVQINQIEKGEGASGSWIRIASSGTILKIWAILLSVVVSIVLFFAGWINQCE